MNPKEAIPDVLARPLAEARAILEKAGIMIKIVKTTPPRGPELGMKYRVVKQSTLAENHVELVIAAEITGKEVQKSGV